MSSVLSSLESLNGLIAFASAVQTGGFSAAGRQLGLSASAVGKAVERLEFRLGTRLLNRTTRSLALTGEGEVLYHYVDKVLKDLQEAERELNTRQGTPRGRLRITATPVLGRRFLVPALHDFHALYPEVKVALSFDLPRPDIIEEGFDLALWAGELEDSSLQARRVGSYALITCASPGYLAENGTPTSIAELGSHCCLHYRHRGNQRLEPWRFQNHTISKPPIPAPDCHLNDAGALVEAAVAGLCIVQLPDFVVREEIATGRLREVLQSDAVAPLGVFLVWPPMSAQALRVRVFIEFISKRAGDQLSITSLAASKQP